MQETGFPALSMKWIESSLDRLNDLSILRRLSDANIHHLEENQLLLFALRLWMNEVGADIASVHYLEQGQWREAMTLVWGGENHCVEASIDKTVLRGHFSRLCRELDGNNGVLRRSQLFPQERRGGSMLMLPLHTDTELMGAVFFYHAHDHFFAMEHEHLGAVFANMLAKFILANRLVKDLHQEVRQRMSAMDAFMEETLQLKQTYQQLSYIDDLTQLHNRRYFFKEATLALARNVRTQDPFALIMLDIDHFKRINDRYGHPIGDEVLRAAANFLKSRIRETDILARFGGEEFALALPGTPPDGVLKIAQVLLEGVQDLAFKSERGEIFHATISIGWTYFDPSTTIEASEVSLEQLLRDADQALYAAKQNGRNQVCAYAEMTHCIL